MRVNLWIEKDNSLRLMSTPKLTRNAFAVLMGVDLDDIMRCAQSYDLLGDQYTISNTVIHGSVLSIEPPNIEFDMEKA